MDERGENQNQPESRRRRDVPAPGEIVSDQAWQEAEKQIEEAQAGLEKQEARRQKVLEKQLQAEQKVALKQEKKVAKKQKRLQRKEWMKQHKLRVAIIIMTIIVALAGVGVLIWWLLTQQEAEAEKVAKKSEATAEPVKYYSKLTGVEIAEESINDSPLYCMQIPNGMDGARPQVGLAEAGVVFEAIAEAGITRFAAVFQNPQSSVLGPIRSLRSYYLDWDTPFDCTVVHAGGSDDALQALRAGGYRDLTESVTYMWRDYSGYYAPNNLFTSPSLLAQFNADNGYGNSDFTAFARMKPETAQAQAKKVVETAEQAEEEACACMEELSTGEEVCECAEVVESELVESVAVNFGNVASYNVIYTYDRENNVYLRADGDGTPHMVYECPAGADGAQVRIKAECAERQLAPSAVAVMMVEEGLASDRYHQVITTSGSGTAYIIQNGTVTEGIWQKSSKEGQIEFREAGGGIISFAPGQLWVEAVPRSSGSVKW